MRPPDTSEDEGDETEDIPPSLPAEDELRLFGHAPAYPGGLEIIDPDEDEEEDDLIEDSPRTVLITGACGNIGRKLRDAWAETYDLILLDIEGGPSDPDVIAADLGEFDEEWVAHFSGVDTVVHLAASTDEHATWEEVERANLDALANVFHASALAGVERLIFASSSHAMGGYKELGDMPISVDLPPRPDGPYGATKLVGERLGKSLAAAFDLAFIALRLGWIQEGANRAETLPDPWARDMWLSNGDLIRLFDCAAEAELDGPAFVVVNGVSNNRGSRWDLSDAAERLGFSPEDDAYAEEL
jgi:nucleoside-diphosphate-sugar epimerase